MKRRILLLTNIIVVYGSISLMIFYGVKSVEGFSYSTDEKLHGVERSDMDIRMAVEPEFLSTKLIAKAVEDPPARKVKSDRVQLHKGNYVTVTATKYNCVASQCDADPLITADNSKINLNKLNSYELRWIAVSQEMTKVFNLKMGDKVIIESSNPRISGIWEIHDHMNERYTRRIDFLVPLNDNYGFRGIESVKLRKYLD